MKKDRATDAPQWAPMAWEYTSQGKPLEQQVVMSQKRLVMGLASAFTISSWWARHLLLPLPHCKGQSQQPRLLGFRMAMCRGQSWACTAGKPNYLHPVSSLDPSGEAVDSQSTSSTQKCSQWHNTLLGSLSSTLVLRAFPDPSSSLPMSLLHSHSAWYLYIWWHLCSSHWITDVCVSASSSR